MEHIRQTLQGVIQDIEKKGLGKTQSIFQSFQDSLTSKERKHIKCNRLYNGVLTVNVDSSVWLYQLTLRKETLVDKLGLKNIRFCIGEIK